MPCSGSVAAFRASVPEAAVHEHGHALGGEIKVWPTWHGSGVECPTRQTSSHEGEPDRQLGAFVAFATDGRHNARTGRGHPHKATVLQLRFEDFLHCLRRKRVLAKNA